MTSLTIQDVDTDLLLKLKYVASRFHESQYKDIYYLYCEIHINDISIDLFSKHYPGSIADIHNIKKSYDESEDS